MTIPHGELPPLEELERAYKENGHDQQQCYECYTNGPQHCPDYREAGLLSVARRTLEYLRSPPGTESMVFPITPGTITIIPAPGQTIGECIDQHVPGARICEVAYIHGTLQIVHPRRKGEHGQ